MKKILALALLMVVPSIIHSMENVKEVIHPNIVRVIATSLSFRTITKKVLSPDTTKVAILDNYGIVSLWDASSGEDIDQSMATKKGKAYSIGFNDTSTQVIIKLPITTETYDIISSKALRVIEKGLGYSLIIEKRMSPDRTKIVILDNYGKISLWNAASGKPLDHSMATNKEKALSIGFNEASTQVVVTMPTSIETYDIVNPYALKAIKYRLFYSSLIKKSVSPDGTKIVTLDSDGIVSLWNALSGEVIDRFLAQNKETAQSIEFNDTSTKVIITMPLSTELCDIINVKVLRAIEDNLGSSLITKKRVSLDGTKIVSLATNGIISLWDATSGKSLEKYVAHNKEQALSIGFNEDGTKIIVTFPTFTEEFPIRH